MMQDKTELKPCPFCGGEPEIIRLKYNCRRYYKISCKKCNIRQYRKRKKHEAVSEWNTRPKSIGVAELKEYLKTHVFPAKYFPQYAKAGLLQFIEQAK